MEFTLRESLLALPISFVLSSLFTPVFRRLAISLRVFDKPNQEHKSHTEPIPYLGGAAIVTTCLTLGTFSMFTYRDLFLNQNYFLLALAAPVLLAIVGLIDDVRNLSAGMKFLTQSVTATLISLIFYSNDLFGAPSGIPPADFMVTTLWIVGITNAINLMDNLDGGAGGVIVIASIFLTVSAMTGEQYFLGTLSSILAGATLGFLIWNLQPARIYLGDSGALFLGSIISILILRLDPEAPTAFASWAVAFSLMAIPVLDTTVVVLSRLKKKVSIFKGAQDHISHRLLNQGFSKRQSALTIWGLAFYFCALGTLLNFANFTQSILLLTFIIVSWISLCVIFLKKLAITRTPNS